MFISDLEAVYPGKQFFDGVACEGEVRMVLGSKFESSAMSVGENILKSRLGSS